MRKKAKANFLVKRLGENYGWAICAACLIELFCCSGLGTCFYGEAIFILIMTALVWFLACSNPKCINSHSIGSVQVTAYKVYVQHSAAMPLMLVMIIALGFYGIPSNIMTNHISVLYSAENYEPGSIALMVALLGGALAVGKLTYWAVADHIGTVRASLIFYILVAAGGVLCCMAGRGSVPLGVAAVCILGVGLAVSSVSISIYAAGVATGEQYAQTVTRFQLGFNLGALLFGRVPGMIADRTGSYVGAYQIMTAIAVISSAVLLVTYRRIQQEDRLFVENSAKKPVQCRV